MNVSHLQSVADACVSLDLCTGAVLGSPVTRIERRLNDLRDIFAAKLEVGKLDPKTLPAIAEHSICQPGRTIPHLDSQPGSNGLAFFNNTKFKGSSGSTENSPF